MNGNALSYIDFHNLLKQWGSQGDPAQLHGLLAGLAAVGVAEGSKDWEEHLLDNVDFALEETELEALQAWQALIMKSLSDTQFGFQLLLPDEDQPISQRTQALGLWCQGFMAGIAGMSKALDEEVQSILRDIAAIAQIEAEGLESEENEMDLVEVMEYVRMAVITIFTQCVEVDDLSLSADDKLH